MYKQTAHSHQIATRSGNQSDRPQLRPQKEDVTSTGGGAHQRSGSDGMLYSEEVRRKALADINLVDDKKNRLEAQIRQTKYSYRKSGVGCDPRLLHKWETDLTRLKQLRQQLQTKLSVINSERRYKRAALFEQAFIGAARELLHPDVLARIESVAQERASQMALVMEAVVAQETQK